MLAKQATAKLAVGAFMCSRCARASGVDAEYEVEVYPEAMEIYVPIVGSITMTHKQVVVFGMSTMTLGAILGPLISTAVRVFTMRIMLAAIGLLMVVLELIKDVAMKVLKMMKEDEPSPPKRSVRNVATQSQATYTACAKHSTPRFTGVNNYQGDCWPEEHRLVE